jgi:hypothetical protein
MIEKPGMFWQSSRCKWNHYVEATNYGDFGLISYNTASKFSDKLESGTKWYSLGTAHDTYDFDEDGYLDYEEQHTYELDKATDYEKNYTIKEMFIDKERRSMYFELENRNSYNVDFAHLNVAFYDEEGRLVDVEEKYIDNILTNQKVIECIDYNRPFATYDVNITVEWTSLDEEVPNNNANMEIVSKEINKEDGELIYTIKNNSEKEVSGDIYVIFYDEGNKIVNIYRDYVYDLKSGGTEELEAYIYDDSIFSTYDIVLTGVQVDEY